jgi:DNA-binding NtrC family response regulator
MTTNTVLLVDDDEDLLSTLVVGLKGRGFDVTPTRSPTDALAMLNDSSFDAVLCDLTMPQMDGIELCRRVVEMQPGTPVIVLTGFGSYDTAVAAIRAGAYDFLAKPAKLDVIAMALRRSIDHRHLRDEVKRLQREVGRARKDGELVGRSHAMREVSDLVARVAAADVSVVITGESGTGKELVARELHALSERKNKPFVAINCAAVPEHLLESELFGHVRGAFTDAREGRVGLLRQAQGGTIFLDEIGDMPLGLQPKLLRVLQERKVRPVGAEAEVAVDVRFLAATHRDLEAAIEERRFREDLYFRLNVVNIHLPPLRARGQDDVLALAQHFIAKFAAAQNKSVLGIGAAAAERLIHYEWPGNVRELANSMEHAVTLTRFDSISPDDLPARVRDAKKRTSNGQLPGDDRTELVSLEEMERRYVLLVLHAMGGNKTAAARMLRIERKTLYRKLEQWSSSPDSEMPPGK